MEFIKYADVLRDTHLTLSIKFAMLVALQLNTMTILNNPVSHAPQVLPVAPLLKALFQFVVVPQVNQLIL